MNLEDALQKIMSEDSDENFCDDNSYEIDAGERGGAGDSESVGDNIALRTARGECPVPGGTGAQGRVAEAKGAPKASRKKGVKKEQLLKRPAAASPAAAAAQPHMKRPAAAAPAAAAAAPMAIHAACTIHVDANSTCACLDLNFMHTFNFLDMNRYTSHFGHSSC